MTVNTFRPALVLVPTGLSRHQSGVGTSTKPIFISLLKKSIGRNGFGFVALDSSMFVDSVPLVGSLPARVVRVGKTHVRHQLV